jgi:VWFA-related protein
MRLAVPSAVMVLWGLAAMLSLSARASELTPLTPQVGKPTEPPHPADEAASSDYKLRVDVNLVLVEATVRDERGRVVDGLKREDFRVLEDGAEQEIRHFSRDELPLAVAIVVDRSGSVSPVLDKLREAALDTLSLLKSDDQVALFAFAAKTERLVDLTTDRQRIAEAIAKITAGGGTNITDALFDATRYLRRAAPSHRHAIVLVSDNQTTVRGKASADDVVRSGLESETTIYSIRIGTHATSRYALAPVILPGTGSVKKMTSETGGEVFEAYDGRSIKTAMAAVINRLKRRYTLGYVSTNREQDGKFRKIDVSLNAPSTASDRSYQIFARRGYYAPTPPSAPNTKTR